MKGGYKKLTHGKETYVSGRLRDKDYIRISTEWKQWAKRYLNKVFRRQKVPYEEGGD